MSISENFFSAAKQLLLTAENIKRLDDKVSSLTKDVAAIDRRLIRVETFIELSQPATRRRTLPGETQ